MHHSNRTAARDAVHRAARGAVLLLGAAGALALGACERELPTDVGGEHLPESALRTYEIILGSDVFLAADSALRGFGTQANASVLLVAEDYRDTLDAHGLIQFGRFPETITYVDSGTTRTDTITAFAGGRVVLRIDTTTLFVGNEPFDSLPDSTAVEFSIHTLGETFDSRTASWRAREVVAGDSTLWSTPGGTIGTLIGTRTFITSDSATGDSIVFTIDSATVAAWAASADPAGIVISATMPGTRAHVLVPRLHLDAYTQEDPDTTRGATAVVQTQTYVYDPPPPAPLNELRVGDRSSWRSFLTFAPRLDSLTIPCPDGPAGCVFTLGDVTVNKAELHLSTLEVPRVWRSLGNLAIELRPVLGVEAVPLERSPLGDTTGIAFGIEPASFEADGDSIVRIGVSRFVRGLLSASADTAVTERARTIALLSTPEPLAFGIGRFGGLGTPFAPVLRLIVTLPPSEEEE